MVEDSSRTVGLDLGDRWTHFCVLDASGAVEDRGRVPTSRRSLEGRWTSLGRCRIALETGSHSPWISRLLEEQGHEVIVANARQVRLLGARSTKTDRLDAELLARLARSDVRLLGPVRHRGAQAQADRALLQARDTVVQARTKLINCARGLVKALGARLPTCSAAAFGRKAREAIPAALRDAVAPLVSQVDALTQLIREYERRIDAVSEERYPATALLRTVNGVGPITALAYVLTLGDPSRFRRSRMVGPYLGLCPRTDQSGACDPQLPITKAGDRLLRRLLLQCAHYILGPFGTDCDLRRWGLARLGPRDRGAKKRALVAVARKLAVRLHRMWMTGETYDPLRVARARGEIAV